MKTIKLTFFLSALLLHSILVSANNLKSRLFFGEPPAKSVVIKNPAADDSKTFFSNSTIYAFEVFKIGDAKAMVELIRKNNAVEACVASNPIGDFTPIQLSLKAKQNKTWFINLFKSAGLNFIRINHNEVVATEKM